MAIHVFIPTLQGLSHVQSIIKEDADVPSVICLNGTSQSLPISNAYYDFVKKGQGVIAKDFGHAAWRIDLSEPVEMGNSWQLGIYIAHYLHSINELGTGELKKGDTVIWASGEVKTNRDIAPVEGVERKLQQSSDMFNEFKNKHIQIVLVMSEANHHLLDLPSTIQSVALTSCGDLSPLFSSLECTYGAKHHTEKSTKKFNIAIAAAITIIGLLMSIYYQIDSRVDHAVTPNLIEQGYHPKDSDIQQGILVNSAQLPFIHKAENSGVPYLHILQKTLDQACDELIGSSNNASYMYADILHYFKPLALPTLCELSISFGNKSIVSAYLYSTSTNTLLALTHAKSEWLIPLPSNRNNTRKAILLGFEKHISEIEQAKLKRFLSINIEDEGMNANSTEKLLNEFSDGDVYVFGLTLSHY